MPPEDLSTKEPNLGKATLPLGFQNFVRLNEVVMVWNPKSKPAIKARLKAHNDNRLIDATHGHKTRAILITNSNHVILSAVSCETLRLRAEWLEGREGDR